MCELEPARAAHYSHERSAAAFAERGAILFLESILDDPGVAHDPLTDWYEFEASGALNPYRKTGTQLEGWRA